MDAQSFCTAVDTFAAPYNVFKQSDPMTAVTVCRLQVVLSRGILPPIIHEAVVQLVIGAALAWYTMGISTNDLSKSFILRVCKGMIWDLDTSNDI